GMDSPDTSPVRKILKRLEDLELIAGQRRPGKTTIWTVNFAWTPVRQDRPTPDPQDRVRQVDPGPTPVQPRSSRTYEGEGEGTSTSLSLTRSDVRGEREGAEIFDFRKALARSLRMDRGAVAS